MTNGEVVGVPRGQKTVQLVGLGLKATVPLGFSYFWRGLARQKSILKVLVFSFQLGGLGGLPVAKKRCN